MQTFIFILILFLISIFGTLLYFKSKSSRVLKLNAGICPTCNSEAKVFFDENNQVTFKEEVIKTKVLKSHGCSGSNDIEYTCKVCGLKEIYSQGASCGIL